MFQLRLAPRFLSDWRRILALSLATALVIVTLSPAVWAGNGRKYFKEGLKYEAVKQWDKAAEFFAQALQEDPRNVEYQLHLQRALFNASMLCAARARQMEEQGDYEGAYHAYREAYRYDQTNEVAFAKMKEMLKKQGIEATPQGEPAPYQRTAAEAHEAEVRKAAEVAARQRYVGRWQGFINQPIETIIRTLCDKMRLNVVFESTTLQQLANTRFTLDIKQDMTAGKALELVLDANGFQYFRVDTRTILIVKRGLGQFPNGGSLAQKYEDSLVKPFYVKNAKLDDIKQMLTLLGPAMTQQVVAVPQSNMLLVRSSGENLKIIERMINAVDRPQAEVVMDVNIYEVTHQEALQLGNQLAVTPPAITSPNGDSTPALTPPSATNLGGIGQGPLLRPVSPAGIFTNTLGFGLGLPPSTITALQSRGLGRLISQIQVRAFEDKEGKVNIGQSIPIQIGNPFPTVPGAGQPPGQIFFPGFNQVQYRDVGLNISVKPHITDDIVQMDISIETSTAPPNTGPQNLTPTISQRKVSGVARVRDGYTALAASVMREDDTDSRTGLPVISFIPVIGRLFSTPSRNKQATHIVITITPHIVRGGAVTEEELKTAFGPLDVSVGVGGLSYGRFLTIDEIVADADHKEMHEANQLRETPITVQPLDKPVGTPAAAPPVSSNRENGRFTITSPGATAPAPAGPVIADTSPMTATSGGSFGATIQPLPVTEPPNVSNPDAGGMLPQGTATNPGLNPNNPNNPTAQPASGAASPVRALLMVSPNLRPLVGQVVSVAVILNSDGTNISAASVFLHYNQTVLKLVGIRDGGLLSPGSFQTGDNGGQAFATALVSPSVTTGRPAMGPVAIFDFQVIAPGNADVRLDVLDIRGLTNELIPAIPSPAPPVIAGGMPNGKQ
ncbi:MAG: secretin N-terminal domain-containing protein [Acidobacteriota bacterium]